MGPLPTGSRVALLTSGGDAPGMNAALRGLAHVGKSLGYEMLGFEDGFRGLLDGRLVPLEIAALDEAARAGGTWLGTARAPEFATPEGQARARAVLVDLRVHALVVVGGNGSLTGARTLVGAPGGDGRPLLIAGLPASIDNDLAGTSMSVGADTALNTIIEAVDRLCDTAAAHHRTFIVEVMGRDCGWLAMNAGVAVGADTVLVPEVGRSQEQLVEQVCHAIHSAYERPRPKRRVIVLKAEGVHLDCTRLKALVDAKVRVARHESRVTVLGHIVRGGSPTAFDRLLASRLANGVMQGLAAGESDFMAGWMGPGARRHPAPFDPYVVLTPIAEVLDETQRMMRGEHELAKWRRATYEHLDDVLQVS